MVKARCYAKFLPPSFGRSADSFSGNYGFYAEIHGLMARGSETQGLRISIKRGPKGKTLARSFGKSEDR
jgi:hypothetical protein